MEANYPKLYYNYKRTDDEQIRNFLSKIKIVSLQNKGLGTVHGYYEMEKESLDKILEKPRNVSLTFDAAKFSDSLIQDLTAFKKVVFLVKSSSRFFLKPDIGEVFDQMSIEDRYGDVKAIYVDLDRYETISDTEGEHFLMIATLLK